MYRKIRHYRPDEVDEFVEEPGEPEETPYDAEDQEMVELVGHRVMQIESDDD